jgi:hypothetical protein
MNDSEVSVLTEASTMTRLRRFWIVNALGLCALDLYSFAWRGHHWPMAWLIASNILAFGLVPWMKYVRQNKHA